MSKAPDERSGNGVAAPKLLLRLQQSLDEALPLADAAPPGPAGYNEQRLQLHRHALEELSSRFRTYQPLLVAVQREYEHALGCACQAAASVPALEAALLSAQADEREKHALEAAELREGRARDAARASAADARVAELEREVKRMRLRVLTTESSLALKSKDLLEKERLLKDADEGMASGEEVARLREMHEKKVAELELQRDQAFFREGRLKETMRSMVPRERLDAAAAEVSRMRAGAAVSLVGRGLSSRHHDRVTRLAEMVDGVAGCGSPEELLELIIAMSSTTLGRMAQRSALAGCLAGKADADQVRDALRKGGPGAVAELLPQQLAEDFACGARELDPGSLTYLMLNHNALDPDHLRGTLAEQVGYAGKADGIPSSALPGSLAALTDTELSDHLRSGELGPLEALLSHEQLELLGAMLKDGKPVDEVLLLLRAADSALPPSSLPLGAFDDRGAEEMLALVKAPGLQVLRSVLTGPQAEALQGMLDRGVPAEELVRQLRAASREPRAVRRRRMSMFGAGGGRGRRGSSGAVLGLGEGMMGVAQFAAMMDEASGDSPPEDAMALPESLRPMVDAAKEGEGTWEQMAGGLRVALEEQKRTIDQLREELLVYRPQSQEDGKGKEQGKSEGDDFKRGKFFTAQGTGASVPKYLRFKGKVRNRALSKRDTEMLVKDVWKQKLGDPRFNDLVMEEFFYIYLQKKVGIQAMIAEWGYNVLDALKRYAYDADCEMFLKILKGEIGQEVHTDQMKMIDDLMAAFKAKDLAVNGAKTTGRLLKKECVAELKAFFPDKSKERSLELRRALEQDQPGNWVLYDKLFEEDREGNQGEFAEAVRDQFLQEREDFLQALDEAIMNEARVSAGLPPQGLSRDQPEEPEERAEVEGSIPDDPGVGAGEGPPPRQSDPGNPTDPTHMTIGEARRGLQVADPKADPETLREYLCRGFSCAEKELVRLDVDGEKVAMTAFMKRIRMGSTQLTQVQHKRRDKTKSLFVAASTMAKAASAFGKLNKAALAGAAISEEQEGDEA